MFSGKVSETTFTRGRFKNDAGFKNLNFCGNSEQRKCILNKKKGFNWDVNPGFVNLIFFVRNVSSELGGDQYSYFEGCLVVQTNVQKIQVQQKKICENSKKVEFFEKSSQEK